MQNRRSEKYETKLDILNKQLLGFKNFLSSTEKEALKLKDNFDLQKKNLMFLINNIEEQKKSIKNNKSKITVLEKERKLLVDERELQTAIVKKQIRLEYERGAFDYLKFLLSQETLKLFSNEQLLSISK